MGASARRPAATRTAASSSASGRRARGRSRSAVGGRRRRACDDAGHGVYEASRAGASRRRLLLRARRVAGCPIPARAGSPRACAGPSRVLDPAPRRSPFERSAAARAASSTSCTSARSRPTGTFEAAIPHLRELAELGVTAIEIMPVAEFPGAPRLGLRRRLHLAPPSPPTAGPHGLRALGRRRPTTHGLAVILDVVYNHVGASGDAGARGVRALLHRPVRDAVGQGDQLRRRRLRPGARVGAARAPSGWVRDFGIDGLRLDAIHAIFDASAEHIVAAVARRVARSRDPSAA